MSATSVSLLEQRRIEAEIVKPLLTAFEAELGRKKTQEILARVIVQLARQSGRQLRQASADDRLQSFAAMLPLWQQDDALELEILESGDKVLRFNVTRCRYAEMYRDLGLDDLGCVLSCNRDAALIEGFSARIKFTRTQTLMEGAPYCDFLYNRQTSDLAT